jgi:hypothetical protein
MTFPGDRHLAACAARGITRLAGLAGTHGTPLGGGGEGNGGGGSRSELWVSVFCL